MNMHACMGARGKKECTYSVIKTNDDQAGELSRLPVIEVNSQFASTGALVIVTSMRAIHCQQTTKSYTARLILKIDPIKKRTLAKQETGAFHASTV